VGNYRWVICALLFFCTTINYIDRNSLSVLKTTLQRALGWTDVDYGWITFAFTFAYAAFPSLIGVFVDRFGVKKALGRRAGVVVAGRGRRTVSWRRCSGSSSCASCSASPKRPTSRRPSRPSECGSRRRDVRLRDRHLQLRHQRRRHGVLPHGVDCRTLGLAGRLRIHRRHRIDLAVLLAEVLRCPRAPVAPRQAELEYIQAGLPATEKAVKVPWTALLRIAKSGRSSSANSSPILCGGSTCSGCRRTWNASAARIR
jgi:hypothetical protein